MSNVFIAGGALWISEPTFETKTLDIGHWTLDQLMPWECPARLLLLAPSKSSPKKHCLNLHRLKEILYEHGHW